MMSKNSNKNIIRNEQPQQQQKGIAPTTAIGQTIITQPINNNSQQSSQAGTLTKVICCNCKSKIAYPLTLHCNHKLCFKCGEKIISKDRIDEMNTIICPNCKVITQTTDIYKLHSDQMMYDFQELKENVQYIHSHNQSNYDELSNHNIIGGGGNINDLQKKDLMDYINQENELQLQQQKQQMQLQQQLQQQQQFKQEQRISQIENNGDVEEEDDFQFQNYPDDELEQQQLQQIQNGDNNINLNQFQYNQIQAINQYNNNNGINNLDTFQNQQYNHALNYEEIESINQLSEQKQQIQQQPQPQQQQLQKSNPSTNRGNSVIGIGVGEILNNNNNNNKVINKEQVDDSLANLEDNLRKGMNGVGVAVVGYENSNSNNNRKNAKKQNNNLLHQNDSLENQTSANSIQMRIDGSHSQIINPHYYPHHARNNHTRFLTNTNININNNNVIDKNNYLKQQQQQQDILGQNTQQSSSDIQMFQMNQMQQQQVQQQLLKQQNNRLENNQYNEIDYEDELLQQNQQQHNNNIIDNGYSPQINTKLQFSPTTQQEQQYLNQNIQGDDNIYRDDQQLQQYYYENEIKQININNIDENDIYETFHDEQQQQLLQQNVQYPNQSDQNYINIQQDDQHKYLQYTPTTAAAGVAAQVGGGGITNPNNQVQDYHYQYQNDYSQPTPTTPNNNNTNTGNTPINPDKPLTCKQHNDYVQLYCQDDKTLLCVNCLYMNDRHKRHRVQPLKKSIDLIKKENQQFKNEAREKLTLIENSLKICNQNKKLLTDGYSFLSEQITKEFHEIQQMILLQEKKIQNQIQNIFQERLKEYDQMINDLSYLKNCIKEYKDCDKTTNSNLTVYVFSVYSMIRNVLKNIDFSIKPITKNEINICDFKNNKNNLISEINSFGKIINDLNIRDPNQSLTSTINHHHSHGHSHNNNHHIPQSSPSQFQYSSQSQLQSLQSSAQQQQGNSGQQSISHTPSSSKLQSHNNHKEHNNINNHKKGQQNNYLQLHGHSLTHSGSKNQQQSFQTPVSSYDNITNNNNKQTNHQMSKQKSSLTSLENKNQSQQQNHEMKQNKSQQYLNVNVENNNNQPNYSINHSPHSINNNNVHSNQVNRNPKSRNQTPSPYKSNQKYNNNNGGVSGKDIINQQQQYHRDYLDVQFDLKKQTPRQTSHHVNSQQQQQQLLILQQQQQQQQQSLQQSELQQYPSIHQQSTEFMSQYNQPEQQQLSSITNPSVPQLQSQQQPVQQQQLQQTPVNNNNPNQHQSYAKLIVSRSTKFSNKKQQQESFKEIQKCQTPPQDRRMNELVRNIQNISYYALLEEKYNKRSKSSQKKSNANNNQQQQIINHRQ